MFNGKMKAVTFSYDDGITQDIRLIRLMDKYGIKATFNLCSGLLGRADKLERGENFRTVSLVHPRQDEIKDIYKGHEVAVHTVDHKWLPGLSDGDAFLQVEKDRQVLSRLVGYDVIGMAYPCEDSTDERIQRLVRERTGVRYARSVNSSRSFDIPKGDELYNFKPTIHQFEASDEKTDSLIDEFLMLKADEPKLLYIWGHAFEFDIDPAKWDRIEAIFDKLGGHDDIFYGTNRECLLGE